MWLREVTWGLGRSPGVLGTSINRDWGFLQVQGGYSSTQGGHIEPWKRNWGIREVTGDLNEVTKGLNQVSWGIRYVNWGLREVTWDLSELT